MKAKAKITAAPTRRARGKSSPLVAVVMGSANDWEVMQKSVEILRDFAVPFEARVVSAHRTPDVCLDYAAKLEARGVRAVIAGAGGAAHLPGVIAAKTRLPVLGVPIAATALAGIDALYAIVQMPAGIPVATFAVGKPGAANAALFACQILAAADPAVADKLRDFRDRQARKVLAAKLPL